MNKKCTFGYSHLSSGSSFNRRKEKLLMITVLCMLLQFGMPAFGQNCGVGVSTPAYPEGLIGIDAGSTPPPGTVILQTSAGGEWENHMRTSCGNEVPGWNARIVATMTVLNWQTTKRFLGGEYGFMFIESPLASVDITLPNGKTGSVGGPMDPIVMPLTLAWRQKRLEETVQVGEQLGINSYDKNAVINRAMGYYSTLLNFGGTAALSKDRSFRFSVLNHIEFHHEHSSNLHYTLGHEDHFDAGLSKDFKQGPILSKYLYPLTVGAVGWGHFMFTKSHGSDLPWDPSVRPRAWAYGAEVKKSYPKAGVDLAFIWTHSCAARSFAEGGNIYNFKFVKVLRPPKVRL